MTPGVLCEFQVEASLGAMGTLRFLSPLAEEMLPSSQDEEERLLPVLWQWLSQWRWNVVELWVASRVSRECSRLKREMGFLSRCRSERASSHIEENLLLS